ncbi:rhodanese-like domain-containing protein 14, chloroplastic [Ziziphus jujuba]|uniref:Rhodanese-like domain-containing protein 14, chloroplastic n=1 Tax=Ziziphus jujuba TaxID=326968 RepID=A0ABM4AGN7_ZIZJJ|nr:rhodanese-like domain-containing protein 14, chloroplastic [Ziziphus jujuba]
MIVFCQRNRVCPEPHLALGTIKQADTSFVTILVEDTIGGLQVLHKYTWVDVKPVKGASIVNIGDMMQARRVDVKEALRLQKENNFVILDVRPEAEFKEAHPPGAINIQIYRLIKEWTAWDIARRAAFAFFGIFAGTEENPEFIPSVKSKLDKDAKIIVACSAGGTMKQTQNPPEGQQSR